MEQEQVADDADKVRMDIIRLEAKADLCDQIAGEMLSKSDKIKVEICRLKKAYGINDKECEEM